MITFSTLITILQALQLVGLAPCAFMIIFLVSTSRNWRDIIIPILYFLALGCGFLLPLIEVWPALSPYSQDWAVLYGSLLFGESILPALSFLLIMQIIRTDRLPWFYWLVMAVPLIGGSSMVYASVLAQELCVQPLGCLSTSAIQNLFAMFSTALLFLLLMVEFMRLRQQIAMDTNQWRDRYWLVISLVSLNLVLLAIELGQLAGDVTLEDALLSVTIVRLSFIYLVLTLMFRLFDDSVQGSRKASNTDPTEKEEQLGAAFIAMMEDDKFYRDVGCSRESVARKLGVNENLLSRAISHCFKKRFTEVVNSYRVEEARLRLVEEPDVAITNIAFDVGFNSIPSFNRVFKDVTHVSPSEYRSRKGDIDGVIADLASAKKSK